MEDENTVAEPQTATEETPEVNEETIEQQLEREREARIKAEELYQNQKIRAEKAEKLAKVIRPEQKIEHKPEVGTMSSRDLLALMNAKVDAEDVSEVEEYAKFKGISIAEALNSSTIKTILSEKEEVRKTANATSTGTSKRSVKKASDEDLLEAANRGDYTDDAEALAKARMNIRRGGK